MKKSEEDLLVHFIAELRDAVIEECGVVRWDPGDLDGRTREVDRIVKKILSNLAKSLVIPERMIRNV